jgi:hypothetical protein
MAQLESYESGPERWKGPDLRADTTRAGDYVAAGVGVCGAGDEDEEAAADARAAFPASRMSCFFILL